MEEPRQNNNSTDSSTTDRGRRYAASQGTGGTRGYNSNEIRITDLLFMLRKRLVLIIVFTLIGLLVGIGFSIVSYMKGEVNKQYQITTSLAVTSQNADGLFTGNESNPNSTDINLAEKMVDSVIFVLTSEKTIDTAIDQLNLVGISANDIIKNIKVQQYNDTQIIEITLYWRTAQEGVEILNAINENAPAILIDTLKLGDVIVIDDPKSKFLIGGSLSVTTWLLCMVLGAIVGMGITLLELMTRPTLLETTDMEKQFSCEVLGEIPNRPKYFERKRNLLMEEWDYDGGDIYDNFVSTAHIIRQKLSGKEHTCIVATSVAGNEGKTGTVARLGVQLAKLDRKVLLVDLDILNPQLGGMFLDAVNKDQTLNALYHGQSTKEEAIIHIAPGLDLLPTILEEKPLPYDSEIFELISSLKENYDIVLLDTPSVGLVANTMGLSALAEYALLIVHFDGPTMEMIREALMRLRKSGMNVMGCVVNAVKTLPFSANYSREDKYGYSSYYGGVETNGKTGRGKAQGGRRGRHKTEQELEWEKWEAEHKREKKVAAFEANEDTGAKDAADMGAEDSENYDPVNSADRTEPEIDEEALAAEVVRFTDAAMDKKGGSTDRRKKPVEKSEDPVEPVIEEKAIADELRTIYDEKKRNMDDLASTHSKKISGIDSRSHDEEKDELEIEDVGLW